MTNYEKFQLEKYGNIIGHGEKNSRELSASSKVEMLLEQIKNNNADLIDQLREMPDNDFKAQCLEKLGNIIEKTQQIIAKPCE